MYLTQFSYCVTFTLTLSPSPWDSEKCKLGCNQNHSSGLQDRILISFRTTRCDNVLYFVFDYAMYVTNISRPHFHGHNTTTFPSIYDHSIFEAMSIVCQQLLENVLSPFENILNAFVSSNKMEKAFIFDLHPKVKTSYKHYQ